MISSRHRSTTRHTGTAIGLLGVALALVGCASDGEDGSAATVTDAVHDGPLPVTAIDYAYTGVVDRVRAGTTLTLDNASATEVHEIVAIRLPDDETRPVDELVALAPDELAAFFPLVETVLVAPPGEAGFPVEGTGVLAEPGRYALLCVIPTGAVPDDYLAAAAAADGEPPQVDGGPPHIASGMFAEVLVVE
ncbi:hypothetical protein [Ilumatobacter coccineus]|uniref:Blue (type 1) copper domain-containing protein n=1 Tax=Ilumatobacter coccineus (strain NBRC 103263 / KCTC 29153 / YM16-304) TaxID=1313172 RepID=A0A6C7E9M1_ILUCY|nr:hypothetical protein [Ilumatobacter coccineus]BAN01308.1 hypothetical protein YM304_09940 [Ilumatobacter coccineus YM16-304]